MSFECTTLDGARGGDARAFQVIYILRQSAVILAASLAEAEARFKNRMGNSEYTILGILDKAIHGDIEDTSPLAIA